MNINHKDRTSRSKIKSNNSIPIEYRLKSKQNQTKKYRNTSEYEKDLRVKKKGKILKNGNLKYHNNLEVEYLIN